MLFHSLLFDNCIGRKRDVGGGFLAGTCRWSGLRRELGFVGDGNRRDADGHVSKFIALGLFDSYERRETVGRIEVRADVFGTRQECDAVVRAASK